MAERNVVTVFYPESEWQGDLVVQELKDAGIEAYLANRSSASMLGALPFVEMEILVPEEKAAEAKTLIEEFLNRQPDSPPTEEPPAQEEPDEDRDPSA